MEDFNLWDSCNPIVEEAYRGKNYRIWDRPGEGKECLILFSGNGLFYPNEKEVFADIIIKKDRYEYENLAKSEYLHRFARIIFVRDIYKQWYVTGINAAHPDVVRTAELFKAETEGYRVTTAGNSAGGYAAVLFGILMKAERIFSFSGQWDITNENGAPYIERYRTNTEKSRFYDLSVLLNDSNIKTKIYYFWPNGNAKDRYQSGLIKNIDEIRKFEFVSKRHEKTVLPFQIPYLLSMEEKELECLYHKYHEKKIYAWKFLFSTMGIYKGLLEVLHYFKVKVLR